MFRSLLQGHIIVSPAVYYIIITFSKDFTAVAGCIKEKIFFVEEIPSQFSKGQSNAFTFLVLCKISKDFKFKSNLEMLF